MTYTRKVKRISYWMYLSSNIIPFENKKYSILHTIFTQYLKLEICTSILIMGIIRLVRRSQISNHPNDVLYCHQNIWMYILQLKVCITFVCNNIKVCTVIEVISYIHMTTFDLSHFLQHKCLNMWWIMSSLWMNYLYYG